MSKLQVKHFKVFGHADPVLGTWYANDGNMNVIVCFSNKYFGFSVFHNKNKRFFWLNPFKRKGTNNNQLTDKKVMLKQTKN